MTIGQLFGRRIRVRVGDQIVCDLDPRIPNAVNEERSLDVDFSCSTHAKPEPLVTEVTIYGLNRDRRRALTEQQNIARRIAWQRYQAIVVGDVLVEPEQVDEAAATLVTQGGTVVIEAGYGSDFGVIGRGIILPDGLSHKPADGHFVTTIRAQDNRLAWSNAFVSEEIAPGISLVDYQRALAISEQFLSGEIGAAEVQQQAPGLLETDLSIFGYENGKVLNGHTRDESQKLMDTLGLRPFLVDGVPYYLPVNAVRFAEAVVLKDPGQDPNVPAPGGLLAWEEMPRGFVKVHTLLNYRLSAGRQVQLFDAVGKPIGMGTFRVEHAQHAGSNYSVTYNTEAVLRPVTVAPQNNG